VSKLEEKNPDPLLHFGFSSKSAKEKKTKTPTPPTDSPSLVRNNKPRRGNPYPLADQNDRNDEQREHAHDDGKPPERNQESIPLDPLADEKCPSEWDDAAEAARHDEAVARELGIRVNQLFPPQKC